MSRAQLILTMLPVALLGCPDVSDLSEDDPKFPKAPHVLYPEYGPNTGQIAAGTQTGEALDQPIGFPHYTHATTLQMDCQYCHYEARNSIHAGVPPTQTCWNCHKYVAKVKDRPDIQKVRENCFDPEAPVTDPKLAESYATWGDVPHAQLPSECANDKPIAWNKVHDLPDYVYFTHKRHVRAGVDCTECHGQVPRMGQKETWVNEEGEEVTGVKEVMVREASLQMGWCLNCHASHPSINENYGEKADLRRAELKDCWTCHK